LYSAKLYNVAAAAGYNGEREGKKCDDSEKASYFLLLLSDFYLASKILLLFFLLKMNAFSSSCVSKNRK